MIIQEEVKLRRPSCVKRGLIDEALAQEIRTALLTSVNTLLNHVGRDNPDGWFSVYNIVGGENTPFPYPWQSIFDTFYEYYEHNSKKAFTMTARDMGWFMLSILQEDSRHFVRKKRPKRRGAPPVLAYRWVE